ncbi:uncharacterized protein B0T15DRAFT_259982 [Chaetomium strumarium]|uniref:Uncharacterized protein n=1 Tax=Chaetomium strumarium TaxID=1170767 RepID=A0AAJ0GMY9_9PEZI|nr:hypothetical protein B0T15DRAFT_259982 [Chaetomium strumarium]
MAQMGVSQPLHGTFLCKVHHDLTHVFVHPTTFRDQSIASWTSLASSSRRRGEAPCLLLTATTLPVGGVGDCWANLSDRPRFVRVSPRRSLDFPRKILLFAQLLLMTQQARASASTEVLPAENPFAFSEWGRLHYECKRHRRRRPEGVARSTWFTPTESPQHAPRAFMMGVHFLAPGSRP